MDSKKPQIANMSLKKSSVFSLLAMCSIAVLIIVSTQPSFTNTMKNLNYQTNQGLAFSIDIWALQSMSTQLVLLVLFIAAIRLFHWEMASAFFHAVMATYIIAIFFTQTEIHQSKDIFYSSPETSFVVWCYWWYIAAQTYNDWGDVSFMLHHIVGLFYIGSALVPQPKNHYFMLLTFLLEISTVPLCLYQYYRAHNEALAKRYKLIFAVCYFIVRWGYAVIMSWNILPVVITMNWVESTAFTVFFCLCNIFWWILNVVWTSKIIVGIKKALDRAK